MLLLLLLAACGERTVELPTDTASDGETGPPTAVPFPAVVLERAQRMTLPAVPADPTNRYADSPDAIHLGRWLFFDARLSASGEMACATCHDPALGLADGMLTPEGVLRHTPSLWDTAYNRWFYWDGRADSHWSQAASPIENPKEQASSRLEIAHLMDEDPALRTAYETVFGDLPDFSDRSRFPDEGRPGLPGDLHTLAWEAMDPGDQLQVTATFVDVLKAIAAFERTLVLGETRVDQFISALTTEAPEGLDALDASEQRGLILFAGDAGCHFCHAGGLTTNREFHNIGLETFDIDYGRFQGITTVQSSEFNGASIWSDAPEYGATRLAIIAQTSEQLGQFKVPSLRGVSESAPYMHDGSLATLADVINFYDRAEGVPLVGHREEIITPLGLSAAQKLDLEAFLRALDPVWPVDPAWLTAPASPIP
jgi:cytochrome c peroxidase